nr:12702_t:CDS:2 [Entrophospora candida]
MKAYVVINLKLIRVGNGVNGVNGDKGDDIDGSSASPVEGIILRILLS